jgi:hypothetical protein
MDRFRKVLATVTVGLLALLLGTAQPVTADEPNPVTAIDILLEPDATMVKHAEAANARLLKQFPKGFALGPTHLTPSGSKSIEAPYASVPRRACRSRVLAMPPPQ